MSTVRSQKQRSRGKLFWFGVMLILAGLGFLAYVAWQYFGTNVVAKQAQGRIAETIERDWSDDIDGDAVGLLRVDRFGDDYEIPINKTYSDEALTSGVGWNELGALPGEIGNFAIAGHRVTHGEPFRDFLELREGDLVEIETRTGLYVYELRDAGTDRTVDFTTEWVLMSNPIERNFKPTEPILTMLTCSELFNTRNRSVVFGDLVESTPKPTQ